MTKARTSDKWLDLIVCLHKTKRNYRERRKNHGLALKEEEESYIKNLQFKEKGCGR